MGWAWQWCAWLWCWGWRCLWGAWTLWMWWRGAVPLVADALLVSAAGLWLVRRPRPARSPPAPSRCIAHRGAALDAPENTLSAFKYCAERGCKHVEFDLRITKDGKCVLSHDPTLAGKKLSESNWFDIKEINVGKNHPMSEKFGIVNVCLFDEALEFCSEKRMKMIIDVKEMDNRIFTAVINAFKRYPEMHETTIVTSFNPVIIYKIRMLDPRIIGSLNYRPKCFSSFSYSAVGPLRKRFPNSILKHLGARMLDEIYSVIWSTRILTFCTGSSAVILHKDVASVSAIEDWRRAGYSVFLWGVNQPLEKQYVAKIYGVPYIADTLVGEPSTIGEMNGKSH